jgi:hypothetical protein
MKRVEFKDSVSSVPLKASVLDKADRHERGLAPSKNPTRRERRTHRVRGPPSDADIVPGYFNRRSAARYINVSDWMFGELLRKRVIPAGFALLPNGRHFWARAVLDSVMDKARRSRRPKRPVQGIARTYAQRHQPDDDA